MDASRTPFPKRGSVTFEDQQRLTLVDTPGYGQMFLDNVIYGVYIADVALLLVEAKIGLGGGDRDRRSGAENIARILASFRVPVTAVVVTKMDAVDYSQAAFEEVKAEIATYVLPIIDAYQDTSPAIIPVSALSGAGITRNSFAAMAWYQGPAVISVVEDARTGASAGSKRLRFAIEGGKEVYSPRGVGTVLVGSLETGVLRTNDKLLLQPASTKEGRLISIQVRSVQRARSVTEKESVSVDEIGSRAIVAIATSASDLSKKDAELYLSHGGVLGRLNDAAAVATEFRAEVIFFDRGIVYSGKDYLIYPNASRGTARIARIETRGDLGYDLKETSYEANVGERVVATIRMAQPICIESSDEFGRLARFVLRENNRIVACGRCLEIIR